jgi:hypothetical protein
MRSVIYFTSCAPSKLLKGLIAAGYRVFEALEISEVMHLCEHEDVDRVVVASDIDEQEMIEIQLQQIAIKAKPEWTVGDIVWQLSETFEDMNGRIQ